MTAGSKALREIWRSLRRAAYRRSPLGKAVHAARIAAEQGDWTRRAEALRQATRLRPRRADLRVQLAHALKELGNDAAAHAHYVEAVRLLPGDVDVRVHLAALSRRLGKNDEAIARYREILEIDPREAGAMQALIELGAREAMPLAAYDAQGASTELDRLVLLREQVRLAERRTAAIGIPLSRYDVFRERHPTGGPPDGQGVGKGCVAIVLSSGVLPAALRATIGSLHRQQFAATDILIVADDGLLDHPVMSVGRGERRFATLAALIASGATEGRVVLVLPAGTVMDYHGLAWLRFAAGRTGADAVYGDHDSVEPDWRGEDRFAMPRFFAAHDPLELAYTDALPIAVLAGESLLKRAVEGNAGEGSLLRTMLTAAPVGVHVPRRVASRYALPRISAHAPGAEAVTAALDRSAPPTRAVRNGAAEGITVVVPVRDQADMLQTMIDSMLATACVPDRVSIIVVDNRSRETNSFDVFRTLASTGTRIISFDEPFNWSRANNLGAAAAGSDLLVFANNDMTMLSHGWDYTVCGALSDPDTGVVGARLLYPDGTYQHVGIAVANGLHCPFIHEGLGRLSDDPGPANRWRVARRAAAVTGAFMATRAETLRKVGGFKENLAVAYNDIDFCFRVRAAGMQVVYEPDLALIHHESRTRGRNVTADQVAWDEGELAEMVTCWPTAVTFDPSRNPQWALGGVPFDGLREPDEAEVVDWIDRGTAAWGVGPNTAPRR